MPLSAVPPTVAAKIFDANVVVALAVASAAATAVAAAAVVVVAAVSDVFHKRVAPRCFLSLLAFNLSRVWRPRHRPLPLPCRPPAWPLPRGAARVLLRVHHGGGHGDGQQHVLLVRPSYSKRGKRSYSHNYYYLKNTFIVTKETFSPSSFFRQPRSYTGS